MPLATLGFAETRKVLNCIIIQRFLVSLGAFQHLRDWVDDAFCLKSIIAIIVRVMPSVLD